MNDLKPKVFVVDDEDAVRKAVFRLLHSADIQAEVFASPAEFLAAFDAQAPGCLLLDVEMPGLNGLDLQRVLGKRDATLPIIFLSGRADIPISVQAMKAGATDFLTKPVQGDVLLAAVRTAFAKDNALRAARADVADIAARLNTLTAREYEVLEHVVAGKLNKQIASDLGIVEGTIKVHRARVMEKMKVQSLAELVRLVERAGVRG